MNGVDIDTHFEIDGAGTMHSQSSSPFLGVCGKYSIYLSVLADTCGDRAQ